MGKTQDSNEGPPQGGVGWTAARRAWVALAAGACALAAAPAASAACVPGVACAYQTDGDPAPDSGWIAYKVGGAAWTTGDATSVGGSASAGGATATYGFRYEDAGFDADPERLYLGAKADTGLKGHVAGVFAVGSVTDRGNGDFGSDATASVLAYADSKAVGVGLEYTKADKEVKPGHASPK